MRGEKNVSISPSVSASGSPPRARGKEILILKPRNSFVDHPRVRGEKASEITEEDFNQGSPPRARGKDPLAAQADVELGITPACAGKRDALELLKMRWEDHPRVRGEKLTAGVSSLSLWGSPPRARGKDPSWSCPLSD